MKWNTEDKQKLLIKKDGLVVGSIGSLEITDNEATCNRAVFHLEKVLDIKSKDVVWELLKIDEHKEVNLGTYQTLCLSKLKVVGEYAMIERLIMKQV